MQLIGHLISGEFDEAMNEFSLQRFKHFDLESTLNENQFNKLYDYLKHHADQRDGHIITLYDQLPMKLTQEEITLLLMDLEKLQSFYQ